MGVAAVEEELGFRISQRSIRRVAPTKACDVYLRQVQSSITALDRAREDALSLTRGPLGTLRMTSTVAFGQKVIVPLLQRFRLEFPNVDIELVLSDANLDLVSERIDLAIRLEPAVFGDVVAAKLQGTAIPRRGATHRRTRRTAVDVSASGQIFDFTSESYGDIRLLILEGHSVNVAIFFTRRGAPKFSFSLLKRQKTPPISA